MGKLSTHVLNTAEGKPASGVKIELRKITDGEAVLLKTVTTNNDGRTDELLLHADEITVGQYEILFYVSDYFNQQQAIPTDYAFLSQVPIRFGIADASQNFHVPLLISPWSYSTYRGS